MTVAFGTACQADALAVCIGDWSLPVLLPRSPASICLYQQRAA